jgi:mannose-6-phosphate isomerase-like protein (cupin superfamily)
MEPLDLSVRPPRSPYAQMHGVYMVPRTIDKMRAQLPGGSLGPYCVRTPFGPGLSNLLLESLGLNEKDLFELVQQVRAEEEIADWLRKTVDLSSKDHINELLLTPTVEDALKLIPAPVFAELYPAAKNIAKTTALLEVLLEDDRLMFPAYFGVVYSAQCKELPPGNRYLTSLSLPAEDYCLLIGEIPAGAIVPLHSHFDRETFYVLSGEMNFYDGASWQVLHQGEFADVFSNTRHAWHNASGSSASLLIVTTVRMGVFLQQISSAVSTQAVGTERDRFFKLVQEYGYWLASPEDNGAIGLATNWHGVG